MTEETITIGALAECLVRCEASDLLVYPPRRFDGQWGPATALWTATAVRDGTIHEHAAPTLAGALAGLCAVLEEVSR